MTSVVERLLAEFREAGGWPADGQEPELTELLLNRIVGLLELGYLVHHIARCCGVKQSTVRKIERMRAYEQAA